MEAKTITVDTQEGVTEAPNSLLTSFIFSEDTLDTLAEKEGVTARTIARRLEKAGLPMEYQKLAKSDLQVIWMVNSTYPTINDFVQSEADKRKDNNTPDNPGDVAIEFLASLDLKSLVAIVSDVVKIRQRRELASVIQGIVDETKQSTSAGDI